MTQTTNGRATTNGAKSNGNGARPRAGRVPPHNLDAERALLGSMMVDALALMDGLDICKAGDFYAPKHGHVFEAIETLAGTPVDVTRVCEQLRRDARLDAVGGKKYVLELIAEGVSHHAAHYAQTVLELATYRRAIAHAGKLAEAAYDSDMSAVERALFVDADAVVRSATPLGFSPTIDVVDLIEEDRPYRWIVDGLLEVEDWVMITGKEGFGKTTFLRQFGMQVASGIHPFTLDEIAPVRVLHFDFQDSAGQSAREYERIRTACRGRFVAGQYRINVRRGGMNILDRMHRRWFERQIEQARAQVVSFGPLYKIFRPPKGLGTHEEEVAQEVAHVLDGIAERHGIAYMIEAHSPHGVANDRAGWRPIGASLWQRHPHFGIGMAPRRRSKEDKTVVGATLVRWRDDRDRRRAWPKTLDYGREGGFPWLAPGEEVL